MSDNFNYFDEKKEEFKESKEILYAPELNTLPTPLYLEEKAIKKSGNLAGLSMFLMSVAAVMLGLLLLPLNYIPINKDTPISLLAEPAVAQVYQIVFTILVFTVPYLVCYKFADYRISDLVSFKKTEKGLTLPFIGFGLAFCSFANIAGAYMGSFFDSFGIEYNLPETAVPKGVFGFILSILATAVFPALLEEFAIRGIIMGSLRKYGDCFALITSSVCFGVLHGNFSQMPFAFMVGLFLGFTVIKTDSLRIAIILHFINNLVSVLLDYFPLSIPTPIKSIVYILYMLATFVVAVYFLLKTDNKFFTLSKGDTLTEEKDKYKYFFLSGGVVVFVIYNLFKSVSLFF